MRFFYVKPWEDSEFVACLGNGSLENRFYGDGDAWHLAWTYGRELLELITSPSVEVQEGLANLWDLHQRLKAEEASNPSSNPKRGVYSRVRHLREQGRKHEGEARLPR
jgi:hypothetical protein